MKADLHLHSTYSDGRFTPKDLVDLIVKKKIGIASLTDHDSIKGTEEFMNEGKKKGLEVITGLELSCHMKEKEVHLLAYFFNHKHDELNAQLTKLKKMREHRLHKILDKLNELGMAVTTEDISKVCQENLYGRMHVAKALLDKGHTKSIQESFAKFLGNGRSAFVPKENYQIETAVNLIKKAGGVSSIAHPGSSRISSQEIVHLIKIGVIGLEVFHPKHSSKKENELKSVCKKKGFMITGGSDFHGYERKEFDNLGLKYVTLSEIDNLKNKLK